MDAQRRFDLDWLRVLAFFILIYFHAAIIFIPEGLPLIQNEETSCLLGTFVNISSQFRLGLLFLISGVGVAFAKRRHTHVEFLSERSKRLLIPMVFGILFIVPPMVFLEKVFIGDFVGNYLEFYPRFFSQGVYPNGHLSWHHFWFIAYLYIYCIMGMAVYSFLDASNKAVSQNLRKLSQGFWIYLPILPLFLVELCLRPFFPGFRDLIHDWASFTHWFLLFIAGFALANHMALLDRITQLRWTSLAGAILTTLLLFYFFGKIKFGVTENNVFAIPKFIAYSALAMSMVWCTLLSCLGFAGHFLQFKNSVLTYVNEAVYPLFILHLTIITALGYWVVDLQMNVWPKYFIVTTGTVMLVLGIYHVGIRPFDNVRLLFGVKPKGVTQRLTRAC